MLKEKRRENQENIFDGGCKWEEHLSEGQRGSGLGMEEVEEQQIYEDLLRWRKIFRSDVWLADDDAFLYLTFWKKAEKLLGFMKQVGWLWNILCFMDD